MRSVATIIMLVLASLPLAAQEKKEKEIVQTRFGVLPNVELYPQSEPKELLNSVVKALQQGRVEYLLAHLTDPSFIESRMRNSNASFSELVEVAKAKLKEDPDLYRSIRIIAREGELAEQGDVAMFSQKDFKDRKIFVVKIGQRWFIRNERTEKK
ncbi:hypothetical protein KIH39_05635 [Telmatocola sphagniphila]|uniref:Uncharacterized protein n=1 Tax=Telmatocola sphagniphila TaxID=1123043 RepID=A0A8E6EU84_9BACT|nr:hypothetical protein [Telmatocola sphagniphila]QVL33394.1 hypothetical protein KIH39_05635 [Telmatocola sphagniphila]